MSEFFSYNKPVIRDIVLIFRKQIRHVIMVRLYPFTRIENIIGSAESPIRISERCSDMNHIQNTTSTPKSSYIYLADYAPSN